MSVEVIIVVVRISKTWQQVELTFSRYYLLKPPDPVFLTPVFLERNEENCVRNRKEI